PVPVETLLDRTWGPEQPRNARQALYVYVTGIRKLIERTGSGTAVRLVRYAGGYLLDIDPDRGGPAPVPVARGRRARPGLPGPEAHHAVAGGPRTVARYSPVRPARRLAGRDPTGMAERVPRRRHAVGADPRRGRRPGTGRRPADRTGRAAPAQRVPDRDPDAGTARGRAPRRRAGLLQPYPAPVLRGAA